MKTAVEMIQQMGKKKFVEMASKRVPGKRMIDIERRRRIGHGRIFSKYCVHGKQLIKNFQPFEECEKCVEFPVSDKLPDFEPHFNIGLGCYVESRSDMRKAARTQGLEWIGDDRK